MDQIKALHIEMDAFHKKKNLIIFWKLFGALIATQTTKKYTKGNITSFLTFWWKKYIYPRKANTVLHIQKRFQKITMAGDILGTCPNLQLLSL
jgi:hypothetical protein